MYLGLYVKISLIKISVLDVGRKLIKMKADFFNSIISVLLILLMVPGITPGIVSAADGQLADDNSSNSTTHADLTIEKLYTVPKVLETNSDVEIDALVSNMGDAASDPTSIIFTINGISHLEHLDPIDPGSDATVSHSWTTPDKEGTVKIAASIDGVDNSRIEIPPIQVKNPLPDLMIQSIVSDPANPQEGQTLNFTVEVKNQGAATSGAALATYYINGVPGQSISIQSLSEGASTNFIFSLPPDQVKAGQMKVKVVVDSGNNVLESNEITVYVKGLPPDLTVESISLSPESPKVGDNVTFAATIRNIGLGASPASKLKYYINGTSESNSGMLLSSMSSVPALPVGQAAQITFFWAPKSEGNIEITALVDPDAVIPESNEANNQLTITATVTKDSTSGDSGGDGSGSGGGGSSSGGGGGGSSSGSSSGSGIGSSFSKEPAKNVASKELATRNVMSGSHIRYDFLQNNTCVQYIEYDAVRTFLKTTTTVEELKEKSTFVPERPSAMIYKYANVWVGDKGGGAPTSLENGSIGFRVEKSWINNNSINESLVTLQWYNKSWEPLYTQKVGEDNNYSYFISKTPGFSFFAITYTGEADKNGTQIGAKLPDTLLGSLEDPAGKVALNDSGNNSKAQAARGAAKILMALTLPTFLLLVGYLVFKKRI